MEKLDLIIKILTYVFIVMILYFYSYTIMVENHEAVHVNTNKYISQVNSNVIIDYFGGSVTVPDNNMDNVSLAYLLHYENDVFSYNIWECYTGIYFLLALIGLKVFI